VTNNFDATTPETLKREIVDWLNHMALTRRNQARMAERKRVKQQHDYEAKVYSEAAEYIHKAELIKF
jgi:hypothetical protein